MTPHVNYVNNLTEVTHWTTLKQFVNFWVECAQIEKLGTKLRLVVYFES